jgi:hypothetical protein
MTPAPLVVLLALLIVLTGVTAARAQEPPGEDHPERQAPPAKTVWQYGGFVDLGYLLDFNHPANHLFRSRGTTPRVDEFVMNMAAVYLRKEVSARSRLGMELTVQAGEDSKVFGFSSTAPSFPGANWLRHLGPTNVSFLAPLGKGLTFQAGYFNSLIGYDSLYAKNNFAYTRPWSADFTPYLMFGVNASYPFTEKFTGTLFLVNGYWHLANANAVPSSGVQLAYKARQRWTLKQTLLFGPHQPNTSVGFWRCLSDSIVELKARDLTAAFEFQFATENVATPGNPRALWVAAQWPVHWAFNNRWSVTVRPEFAWDRDGRWTSFRQTVKAVTTTVEYQLPYRRMNTIFRLEHRYDDSRGPGGGFFRDAQVAPGIPALTPSQHLLVYGLILTFDNSARP